MSYKTIFGNISNSTPTSKGFFLKGAHVFLENDEYFNGLLFKRCRSFGKFKITVRASLKMNALRTESFMHDDYRYFA